MSNERCAQHKPSSMGKKHQYSTAARARTARWNLTVPPPSPEAAADSEPPVQHCEDTEPHNYIDIESDSCSECEYTGGVNVDSSDSDYEPQAGDLDWETELTDDTLLELSGDELEENMRMLQAGCAVEADLLTQTTAFEKIAAGVSSAAWKKAEKDRGLGYNGQSQQTHEQRGQQARAAAKEDNPQVKMMLRMFAPKPLSTPQPSNSTPLPESEAPADMHQT
ncbi:hypothetical protein EV424DRAFT_1533308 [Suillus variegatus]|nr:hypothetical protein EV424DRAFT_1533308 [Suillus variegatus]